MIYTLVIGLSLALVLGMLAQKLRLSPLVGYLAARETEYTNLRILLMGRNTGLPADVIRARLRQSYV